MKMLNNVNKVEDEQYKSKLLSVRLNLLGFFILDVNSFISSVSFSLSLSLMYALLSAAGLIVLLETLSLLVNMGCRCLLSD